MANLSSSSITDALVDDILTPYLLHSRPKLIQSIGRESFVQVQRLYREIGEVCVGDDKARRTFELFEEDPEIYASSFGLVLQRLLDQDEAWALAMQRIMNAFNTSGQSNAKVAGSGAMATKGGTAAGEMGVAVQGTVAGGIHVYSAQPPAPAKDMTEPERLLWQEQATYLAEAMRAYATQLRGKIDQDPEQSRSPYKNLFYYELSDESIFFGREQATQQFLDYIRGRRKARRLTVLHAPSGAGKTSLINAGVMPALLRSGDVTLYALARVGTDYENPEAAIRKRIINAAPADQLQPDLSYLSMHDFLRLAGVGLDGRWLIIFLDQFEEFFIHLSAEARAPFISELAACYDDEALPVKFVISIRKDYFSDLSELQNAIPAVFYNEFKLELLTRAQAAEAITKPVAPLGIEYTTDVVETLLSDLESSGMELPHLQLICSRLYEARRGQTITLADYEALGRAEGILGGYLASFMHQLGSLKPVAQAVLVEMVTSEDTKRVMSRAELGLRVGEENLDEVLNRLVAGRLLRRDEEGGVIRYEMAHEYLIREITSWIDVETRARKQAEELLAQEVYAWQQFGTLTGPDKLDVIAAQREYIRFTPEAQELLLRSALANGHDLALWPELVGDAGLRKQILDEFTIEPRAAVRAHAAWAWSKLDEPASINALLTLALEDSSPFVTSAAGEGLLRLERQQDSALRELVSIARSDDRVRRSRALAILTRVRLEDLEPGLRWRITMTRLRLAMSHLYNRLLPQPYRRAVAVSFSILLLLLGIMYGFLASYSYLDMVKGSASGDDGLIVIHNGHPSLRSLPGFDRKIVETDFWIYDVEPKEQKKISEGQVVTFKWQKDDTGYESWVEELLALLSPLPRANYGWYLGESPESTVEKLMVAIREEEIDPGSALSALPTLEQVIITHPAVTQQAIDSLADLLTKKDPKLKIAGIVGLSRVVTPKTNNDTVINIISRIAPYLGDSNSEVSFAASEAFRHIIAVAHTPSISREIIDILRNFLGSEGTGSIGPSLLYPWLRTIVAMGDNDTISYTLKNIIELQDDMQPDDYGNILYTLANIMWETGDKAFAEQTVEAIAPLVGDEDSPTFWPMMGILDAAVAINAEVDTQQVFDALSSSLATQDSSTLTNVIRILVDVTSQADESTVAKDVYESLTPLLSHRDRGVRAQVTSSLAQVAAKTEDPGIASQTFKRLDELFHDQDEDRDIRLAALYGIGFIVAEGNYELAEAGIAILREEIHNEDPTVRNVAIKSLSTAARNSLVTEPIFETLTMLIKDSLVANRMAAGFVLVNIIQTTDDPLVARQAVDVISILLEDPVSMARIFTNRWIFYDPYYNNDPINDNSEVVSAVFGSLATLLSDAKGGQVIAGVLENMAWRINDPAVAGPATAALLPFVDHEDTTIRQLVVRSLAVTVAKTDDPELARKVVNGFLLLIKNEDEIGEIKSLAVASLGQAIDVANNLELAEMVSKALEALLEDEDYNIRFSAISASAHARSWLDNDKLFDQFRNPLDKQERDIASRALFLAALRDQDRFTFIEGELKTLQDDPKPFTRFAANQTLEMLNIAAMIHDVSEGSNDIGKIRSYLGEISYALPHIQFAAGEALTKLEKSENIQSEAK